MHASYSKLKRASRSPQLQVERIGFSLPAFTGFDTKLSGHRPTAADLWADASAADLFIPVFRELL